MAALNPIILHSHARGPVPWRVAMIFEELNIPYENNFPEFDEMNSESYKAINPNAKAPAIEDPNTGIKLFELRVHVLAMRVLASAPKLIPMLTVTGLKAGAIILYILDTYDKSGALHSLTGPARYTELAWMQFQATEQHMYYSQHAWFMYKHPEHVQSALDRYEWTIKRTIGVIDEHLRKAGTAYLTGDKVTFADLVYVVTNETVPQLLPGYDPSDEFPHYARWNAALVDRLSFKRITAVRAAIGQPLGKVDQKHIEDHIWRNDLNHK